MNCCHEPLLDGTAAASASSASSLACVTILAFSLPSLGVGCLYLLYDVYVLKFSTDSLLIPPATMGIIFRYLALLASCSLHYFHFPLPTSYSFIFSLSRLWDAISDPLAGYLSDITRSSLGRRRLWMLCSAIPLGVGFAATFSPPLTLAGGGIDGSTGRAAFIVEHSLTSALLSASPLVSSQLLLSSPLLTALSTWMLTSILLYYTALTAFKMPSSALGVELSEHAAYHER